MKNLFLYFNFRSNIFQGTLSRDCFQKNSKQKCYLHDRLNLQGYDVYLQLKSIVFAKEYVDSPEYLNPFKRVSQMTGNWRTRSINISVSNSFSRDLLFICLVLIKLFWVCWNIKRLLATKLFCSSSLVFSILPPVLFLMLLLVPEFHVTAEEAAADSHQADKTTFEKENSL